MGLRQLKHHKQRNGKVYGSSVNALRKRYCADLSTGVVHKKDGSVARDNQGDVISLSKRQMTYRAGVVEGINLSNAATKTKAGLDTSRPVHPSVKIKSTATIPAFGKGRAAKRKQ